MTAQEDAPKIRSDFPDTPVKPGIRPAPVGNSLDPMLVHNGGVKQLRAEIKRSEQGFRETDGVVARLKGWNADEKRGSYISNKGDPLPFGPANLRALNLDPEVVAFNLNQMIEVDYTVYRDGEGPVTSEVLELKVLDLPPEELKAGVIFGKDDDGTGPVLDLTTDTDDRTVRIDIWPLIAEGQWLWIVLKGEDKNGDSYELTLFEEQVDQDLITLRYIEAIVLFSELKLFGDGTDATLQYKVAFDQVDDESKANLSEVRSYTVKATAVEVKPEITAATDSKGDPLTNPDTTTGTTVNLSGTVAEGEKVEIYDGDTLLDEAITAGAAWTYEAKNLSQTVHTFKAKGKYGSLPESSIWTITVKAVEVTPEITAATDSKGDPLTNPDTTTGTTVNLSGTVAEGEKVEIYDGDTLLDEAITADAAWTYEAKNLSQTVHTFKAKGKYGSLPESNIWTVTVQPVQTESPVIESAQDSSNNDVPHESITKATALDLKIKAGKFEQLDIFLNNVWKHKAPTNELGFLHYQLAPLELGDQNITVKGVESELESEIYNVFVVPGPSDGKLVIIAAKDAQGKPVLRGSAMTTTKITFTGTAQPRAAVTLRDVFDELKTVVADLNGYWRLTLSGLNVRYYHLSLSAEDAESPMLWWLAVFAVGTPIIDSATDDTKTIPPYGATSEQKITLQGTGPANGEIILLELLSEVKIPVAVNADSKWKHTINMVPEVREYHYVAYVPGEGSPKSNLYRVRKVEPAK